MDVNNLLGSAEGDQHGLHPVDIFLAPVLLPAQGEEGGEQAQPPLLLRGDSLAGQCTLDSVATVFQRAEARHSFNMPDIFTSH